MKGRRRNNGAPVSLFSFQDIIAGTTGVLIIFILLIVVQKAIEPREPPPPPVDTSELRAEIQAQQDELAKLNERLAKLPRPQGPLDPDEIEDRLANQDEYKRQWEKIRQLEAEITVRDQRLKKLRSTVNIIKARIAGNPPAEPEPEEDQELVGFILPPGTIKSAVIVVLSADQARVGICGQGGKLLMDYDLIDKGFTTLFHFLYAQKNEHPHLYIMVKPSAALFAVDFLRSTRALGFTVGFDPLEEMSTVVF